MTQDDRPASFTVYRGDGALHIADAALLPAQPRLAGERGRYLASAELAEAVNIALAVGQPLLVTGDPGCGKTRLAWSIAQELGLNGPETFVTRSTSKRQDLLYHYDAVSHFRDIQLKAPRAQDTASYIHYAALGRAIQAQGRSVVLIDEIDKAPRDFPNDLLDELDRFQFEIAETNTTLQSKVRPFVLITSNRERELPSAFLRRCVYFHLEFPSVQRLHEIVRERLDPNSLDSALVDKAITTFENLRKEGTFARAPGTAELLAWLQALHLAGKTAEDFKAGSAIPLSGAVVKEPQDSATRAR